MRDSRLYDLHSTRLHAVWAFGERVNELIASSTYCTHLLWAPMFRFDYRFAWLPLSPPIYGLFTTLTIKSTIKANHSNYRHYATFNLSFALDRYCLASVPRGYQSFQCSFGIGFRFSQLLDWLANRETLSFIEPSLHLAHRRAVVMIAQFCTVLGTILSIHCLVWLILTYHITD